jgi:hypothetical protein
MLDPNTTTRKDFSESIINTTIPTNASPKYKKLATGLQEVLRLLTFHPAMTPNLLQTYSTKAASKNEVYFMWDFVGRTLGMLLALDPSLPKVQSEVWDEIQGRAWMGDFLIQDKEGKLEQMTASGYGVAGAQTLDLGKDLGDEVREASRKSVEE